MESNKNTLSVKYANHVIKLSSTRGTPGVEYTVSNMFGGEVIAGFSIDGTPDSLLEYVKRRLHIEIAAPEIKASLDPSKDAAPIARGRK